MNPAQRHQLRAIDAAILALLDERVRLLRDAAAGGEPQRGTPLAGAAVDDLLRRHAGPFPAEGVKRVFAAIDAGCAPAPDERR